MIQGFPPIAEPDARVLILGTMPSAASLERLQYYGHPQNKFWPIIFALWDKKAPDDYQKRVEFLKEKRIALWDVISACERQGSADEGIKRPVANDFAYLLHRCPELEAVFLTQRMPEYSIKGLLNPMCLKDSKNTPCHQPAPRTPSVLTKNSKSGCWLRRSLKRAAHIGNQPFFSEFFH